MPGFWTALANQPGFNADTMLLLMDGTVMCHEFYSPNWHKLAPDPSGSYVQGTWSSLRSMPDNQLIPAGKGGPTNAPLYFSSAVLADGTVFTAGGEYNAGVPDADTVAAQIYDPVSDEWSTISPPPGWPKIGDAPTCVLPDGRLLLGDGPNLDMRVAIYDPTLQTWTAAASKADTSSEETFTLLPDQTVLTVQCSDPPNVEKYVITQDTWVSAASTPADLTQLCAPHTVPEIGPAILLPNQNVFVIGANGHTALYTPPATPTDPGSWAPGPTLLDAAGNVLFPADAPAVLLPNGKVLCTGSTGPACYKGPTVFLEYDPKTNTAVIVAGPANSAEPCYRGRLLLLPTGQVLYSDNSPHVEVYTPDGAPDPGWRPTITACPPTIVQGRTYTVSGTQLNGLSQAVSYGDDAQMATNYPLVRVRQGPRTTYLRASNVTTMGVATGAKTVSVHITVPDRVPAGPGELSVVANGITSDPFEVSVLSCVTEQDKVDSLNFEISLNEQGLHDLESGHIVVPPSRRAALIAAANRAIERAQRALPPAEDALRACEDRLKDA